MLTGCCFSRVALSRTFAAGFLFGSVLNFFGIGVASASTKAERTRAAGELVREALHGEIYGMNSRRGQLLEQAKQEASDFAPAMWHTGHVRVGNEWVKAVDIQQHLLSDRRVQLYQQRRLTTEDTVAGHLALADWCQKMKLTERERAHLTRVIELESDHAAARERLGFRQFDGQWVAAGQLEDAAHDAEQRQRTFQRWVHQLRTVRRSMEGNRLKQETAIARLKEIRDPSAVPAIEALFASASDAAAMAAVEAFTSMNAHEADLALARMAVLSPWSSVRVSAAAALQNRPFENFVPDLLDSMYSPVESSWQLYEGRGGRLMFRQVFVREGQDHKEQMVLETGYRRIALPGGDARDTAGRALTDMLLTGRTRGTMQIGQNLTGQQLNDRIIDVLATVTDEQLPPEATAWWQWWDAYNEVYRSGQKQVETRYRYQEITLVDRVALSGGPTGGGPTGGGSQRCDCLAAGTQVWTDMGTKPIEEMQVGDMVLAQDPETGELIYKPVLRFTIRPASHLVTLNAGGESITTSGGHLFWVSGEGWVRARDAQGGSELHGLAGTVQLSTVETAKFEPSYNIIVADFHTYFVGEEKAVLCHDNTVSRKTDVVVPGLIDR